jgi:hypothetical protein
VVSFLPAFPPKSYMKLQYQKHKGSPLRASKAQSAQWLCYRLDDWRIRVWFLTRAEICVKSSVFWSVMPRSPLKVNGLHGIKSQKAELFITTTVGASTPTEIYLLISMSRLAEGSTQPPMWGMKVTTHLHLVPRLRMHAAVSPLPHTSSCVMLSEVQWQLQLFTFI